MKKMNKKDFVYILITILLFLAISFIVTNGMYLYGSNMDWSAQHIDFVEYFRTLFYNTKDLFPDFALNIGNGQNIYNFSYYGLLNPLYLISYLLPQVSMTTYIIIITILSVIASSILMYIFLKNKKYSSESCFLSSVIFICASCITLHSHRHIMFINYLPFLILGFFGVDKKLNENKGWLLSISVFFTIMTSWYYSVCGIITLVIYGIYIFLKNNKTISFQKFFKTGFNFLTPIIIGILSSAILILPTFQTLLNNRADTTSTISLLDLFIPKLNLKSALYAAYGLGLTSIVIPSLVNFWKKGKENKFLFIILSCSIIFPIVSYLLNAGMYADTKVLIPMLPLFILIIAEFIESLFNDKVDVKKTLIISVIIVVIIAFSMNFHKRIFLLIDFSCLILAIFLYKKFNQKLLLVITFIAISFANGLIASYNDSFVLKYTYENDYKEIKDIINSITSEDNTFYRISNTEKISETVNKNYGNINYYNSTVYSSISNQNYNSFYFDVINNNIPHRNRSITSTTTNIMSLIFSGNKYIIDRNKPLQGYTKIGEKNGINIYRNDDVLPLGFATSNIMSYEEFNQLSSPAKQEALLNVIVADTNSKSTFASALKKIDIEFSDLLSTEDFTKKQNGSYSIKLTKDKKIRYELPKEYQNKIIFIKFDMKEKQDCSEGDQVIKINNSKNKLTCKDWKYYNGNEEFSYVLAEKDLNRITVNISKGNYTIDNLEIYALDYATLENLESRFDYFNIDVKNTKGDVIAGDIDVTNDGYFMLTIPYDQGFEVKIDNKKVNYEKVDEAFIGVKVTKGHHEIKITYEAPLKKVAMLISAIGIIFFALITFFESKRKI